METVRLACMAMATRFELVLGGEDPVWLRAVGEEALREIRRLDSQLSFYQSGSDVSRLNRLAGDQAVPVDARLFRLLLRARELSNLTDGAYDPTVGPLMRCWGLTGREGRVPTDEEVSAARSKTGVNLIDLVPHGRTVRYPVPGMEIDLGGIGKGFAVDEAIRIIREAGVRSGLLHGGTSTVSSVGLTPDDIPWKVAIGAGASAGEDFGGEERVVGVAELSELSGSALSVSEVGSKCFEAGGVVYGHVIDPRTGMPTGSASLAAVSLPSAADADALSTALLVAGGIGCETIRQRFPEARMLVVGPSGRVVTSDFPSMSGGHATGGDRFDERAGVARV